MSKRKKGLYDKVADSFIQGSLEGLTAMFLCLLTMWLVGILTSLVSMNVMITTSAGVGVAFGGMRIFSLTWNNIK